MIQNYIYFVVAIPKETIMVKYGSDVFAVFIGITLRDMLQAFHV